MVRVLHPKGTGDNNGSYTNNAVWIIPKNDKYLLGILNSNLGWFLISNYCTQIRSGYQLIYKYLKNIPIRKIDFKNSDDVIIYKNISILVETMLKLNTEIDTTRTAQDKEFIQRQIDATDKQIDKLVYELYGLTEDEIKIVEEN